MSAAATAGPASFPRLEKYELLEEIGHGGMATVYRARDPRLGREVAVKLIHRHLRENAEVGTRFVAEARAAAKLRHPAIVDVYDVSDDADPERYLVVELVRGTTLRKVLARHRDMPAEVGAAIVQRICGAVEHAHAAGIIHRDIKPENVLVELPADRAACTPPPPSADDGGGDAGGDGRHGSAASAAHPDSGPTITPATDSDPGDTQASPRGNLSFDETPKAPAASPSHAGRARKPRRDATPRARAVDPGVVIKITDFGIAKILDAQGVTSTGQVLGSPAHMAPEQIEGGDVDARTDVFALGVLLYECLVGHLPFEGKNPAQVLRRVLEGAYPAADHERPSVGGRWASIVAKALAHDPAERFPSAAALGDQIQVELEALGCADGRAEIAAFFADPDAYPTEQKGRLVPRLTARGEAARKAGDVWGAAADYNRALALAPDDLTILKRIAGLNSSRSRRLLVKRALMIVAGSAALGVGAFAVARTLKARGAARDPDPLPSAAVPAGTLRETTAPTAERTASIQPEPRPQPVALLSATSASVEPRPRIAATPGFNLPPPPPAAATTRKVVFVVQPGGAKLAIDGAERPWLGVEMALAVGPHNVEATPTDKRCCKRTARVVNVAAPPDGNPGDVQTIPFALDLVPAMVSLASNAPTGAQLYCPTLGITVVAGTPVSAKLPNFDAEGNCQFTAPSLPTRYAKIRLRPGDNNTIPWPK